LVDDSSRETTADDREVSGIDPKMCGDSPAVTFGKDF